MQFTYDTLGGQLTFGPAFNKTFLEEVFRLQEAIEAIGQNESAGIQNICFAPMISENEERKLSNCAIQSVFGYFQNSWKEFNSESEDPITGAKSTYLNKMDKCLS